MKLTDSVKFIPKIGEKRAGILYAEMNIKSVEDLLFHFPYRYIDVRKFYKISELQDNMPYVQILGQILNFSSKGQGRARRLVAEFYDGRDIMNIVWFSGEKFILQKYKTNTPYVIFGKPKLYGRVFSISHPEIEEYQGQNSRSEIGFKTLYNTTEKMKEHYLNSNTIRGLISNALLNVNIDIPEVLPEEIITKYRFISRREAIFNIHLPKNQKLLDESTRRLKFEELFYIQISILKQSIFSEKKSKGFVMDRVGHFFNSFYKDILPFSLTGAQKRVIKEIYRDVKSGEQMNRLLQGDVGSGKTVVALFASLIAVDNGYQACIMAPTEILASQHYRSISSMVQGLNVNVTLLVGATKKKDREQIHQDLEDGSMNIIVGTHALLEDNVIFKNLGLVVIDEQHRFGVAQRAKLWKKNTLSPHILVMTATPIPRTLAMTLYGNLDISVIDELPPGRKPILTYHYYDNKRQELYRFIRKQIAAEKQIYVVYPLIQESEKLDIRNLEDGYIAMKEALPDVKIDYLHGKMKPADKDERMSRFKAGETKMLMSTTVIEVGVDVPNASVMIIENAERFGLSQLHQLRGRVGRGSEQSYCILMTDFKLSDTAQRRMKIMTETNDGFQIAEEDLTLRGPGDIEGTAQSGLPFDLHIANLAKDGIIIQTAREEAKNILEQDPQLKRENNSVIYKHLLEIDNKDKKWSQIS